MSPDTLGEQLNKYLTDVHSIERQALAQMKVAPELAGDPELSAAFAQHLTETEGHERLVSERLQARGASTATVKDLVGTLTGKGFTAFARVQPDTPGKLVVHAFSYEHMELAAYELLAAVAERAGDPDTAAVARRIAEQERRMAERLESLFDQAVVESLREVLSAGEPRSVAGIQPEDLHEQLNKYLTDAHAIEAQALALLGRGTDLAGTVDLASAYEEHRSETEEHQRLIEARLAARGAKPSKLKDAALSLGALNSGAFFAAQPDTPAKLAAFAYAFEHLEIGAYELLKRVAGRAGDAATESVAEEILGEERAAADRIHALFDQALDASLDEQGVSAR